LSKIKGKPGLVATKRTIRGKHAPYQAIRYISTGDLKKRVKDFLGERKSRTKVTKYLSTYTNNIDILYPEELEQIAKVDKNGEKWFAGKKLSTLKRVTIIKYPEELGNIEMIFSIKPTEQHPKIGFLLKYTKERDKVSSVIKFKRVGKAGPRIQKWKEDYEKKLDKKGTNFDKQLGTIMALMHKHDIRVGSGSGGIKEGIVKTEDLKPRMVVRHPKWKSSTYPHVVIEKKMADGSKELFLRSVEHQDKAERLTWVTSRVKSLAKRVVKKPDPELQKELNILTEEQLVLETEILKPYPKTYTEMTRLGHYGATQLEARHVKYPAPDEVWVDFIGKSAVRWKRQITDPKLKDAIRELQKGKSDNETLFPEVEYRNVRKMTNKYKILPKDFRTFDGTKSFTETIQKFSSENPENAKELKLLKKKIFKEISQKLGNQPGMAEKAYVDPVVKSIWYEGRLEKIVRVAKKSYVILLDLIKGRQSNVERRGVL